MIQHHLIKWCFFDIFWKKQSETLYNRNSYLERKWIFEKNNDNSLTDRDDVARSGSRTS